MQLYALSRDLTTESVHHTRIAFTHCGSRFYEATPYTFTMAPLFPALRHFMSDLENTREAGIQESAVGKLISNHALADHARHITYL